MARKRRVRQTGWGFKRQRRAAVAPTQHGSASGLVAGLVAAAVRSCGAVRCFIAKRVALATLLRHRLGQRCPGASELCGVPFVAQMAVLRSRACARANTYWDGHAEAIASLMRQAPTRTNVVLVGGSGAGKSAHRHCHRPRVHPRWRQRPVLRCCRSGQQTGGRDPCRSAREAGRPTVPDGLRGSRRACDPWPPQSTPQFPPH